MDNIYDNKTREETRDKRQFYQDKIGDIVTRQGKTTLKTRKDMTTDNRHDYMTFDIPKFPARIEMQHTSTYQHRKRLHKRTNEIIRP